MQEATPAYFWELNNLAIVYEHMGDRVKAESLLLMGAELSKNAPSKEGFDYLASLDTLGFFYQSGGQYAKAEPLFREAMGIAKKELGEDSPRYTGTLNRLGVLYTDMGEYAKAEPLLKRSMEIRKHVQGEHTSAYATSLGSLGILYKEMGEFAKAEMLFKQEVQIRKDMHGTSPADYAISLGQLGAVYVDMDEYAKAEPLLQESMQIQRTAVGESDPSFAVSLEALATLYTKAAQYTKAEPLLRMAVQIRKSAQGELHPRYAESLGDLGALYANMGEYSKGEPLIEEAMEIRRKVLGQSHPDYANSLDTLGLLCVRRGEYSRAEPLFTKAMEIYRKAPGKSYPEYARSLDHLGTLFEEMGEYSKAESLLEQASAFTRETLGEASREYAWSAYSLAVLYLHTNNFPKAEAFSETAMQLMRKALGESSRDYASIVDMRGQLFEATGDYAKAEPLFRRAIDIMGKSVGESHPDYGDMLSHLGILYRQMGDYARAESLLVRAAQINEDASGESRPAYAVKIENLANLYEEMGNFTKAEPLFLKAAEIEKVQGEDQKYAGVLTNLGVMYTDMGELAKAEALLLKAAQIYKAVGDSRTDYANSLGDLAVVYIYMGDYGKAQPLLRTAAQITRDTVGELNWEYAKILHNYGVVYEAAGNYAKAEMVGRQARAIERLMLNQTAEVESERQQLLTLKGGGIHLNYYLLWSSAGGVPVERAYDSVLSWKGTVSLRQREMLALAGALSGKDLTVTGLRNDLLSASRALSLRCRQDPDASTLADLGKLAARRKELEDLSVHVEELQKQLASQDAEYRKTFRQRDLTSAELTAVLPPGAVLVDIRQYSHGVTPWVTNRKRIDEQKLVAFILRRGCGVARVELGAAQPVEDAVLSWRKSFGSGSSGQAAGKVLRTLVWEPLIRDAKQQMEGATVVLLSPDGPLDRFPLGALPGSKEGTYLVEDVPVSVIPVPTALPDLLEPTTRPAEHGSSDALLVVGGVDYDHAADISVGSNSKQTTPSASMAPTTQPSLDSAATFASYHSAAVRGPNGVVFGPLPETRAEIEGVLGEFEGRYPRGCAQRLERTHASVAAIVANMPRCRWLHIATHGFFADPSIRSALQRSAGSGTDELAASSISERFGEDEAVVGFHPNLLSGLALAGANHPSADDDGILTALEVSGLDLSNVDLAVLSACDTGLGQSAGGEGLLGLQRAFQVAGARSVVASLWKVPDAETRQLMTRFYHNLWAKKMSKLEALREAQIWMLHGGAGSVASEARSFGPPVPARPTENAPTAGPVPPFFWAAFVLSGDWR